MLIDRTKDGGFLAGHADLGIWLRRSQGPLLAFALFITLFLVFLALHPRGLSPLVFQTVPPRLETPDSIDIFARDTDGFVKIIGFIAKDQAGVIQHRRADTLSVPLQQVSRRIAFNGPTFLRGKTLFITAYAIDAANHTGYAVSTGASVPVSADSLGKRDPAVYAYGLTYAMPLGSLGADIAVDTVRRTVYVSNINKNQLEAWSYSSTLSPLPAVSVGAMPWGMTIDNSGSLLLVANSGGTNISKVNLLNRREDGRVKTANEWIYDVGYSVDLTSGPDRTVACVGAVRPHPVNRRPVRGIEQK